MARYIVVRHTTPTGKTTGQAFPSAREMREWVWNQTSPFRNSATLTTCRLLVHSLGNPMLFVTDFTIMGHKFNITPYNHIPSDLTSEETTYDQPPLFIDPPC